MAFAGSVSHLLRYSASQPDTGTSGRLGSQKGNEGQGFFSGCAGEPTCSKTHPRPCIDGISELLTVYVNRVSAGNDNRVRLNDCALLFQFSFGLRFLYLNAEVISLFEYPGQKILVADAIKDQFRPVRALIHLGGPDQENHFFLSVGVADLHHKLRRGVETPYRVLAGWKRRILDHEGERDVGDDCVDDLGTSR